MISFNFYIQIMLNNLYNIDIEKIGMVYIF